MKNSKKKTMRFYLTLAGIKVLIKVLQLCGRNATHVPGRKAINICPDFLDQIDKPEFIIGITGTNGKTTVSNLIADVMQDNGYDIIDNRFGGNIDSGIASSLIKNDNEDISICETGYSCMYESFQRLLQEKCPFRIYCRYFESDDSINIQTDFKWRGLSEQSSGTGQ